MSGFSMLFFVMALAHAMGIQEMVVRDTEDALEREALEDIASSHLNTKKMDMAHHNATGIKEKKRKTEKKIIVISFCNGIDFIITFFIFLFFIFYTCVIIQFIVIRQRNYDQ